MVNYYLAPRIKHSKYTKKFGWPIYLRFNYRGDEAWSPTGIYIKETAYWNDTIKKVVDGANFKLKNDVIDKKLKEAEARILKAIADGDGPNSKAFKGAALISLEEYIKKKCAPNLASGAIKAIKGVTGGKMPDITQITVRFLNSLEDYMYGVGDLEKNSVVSYMGGVMRNVLNHAVAEGYITKSPICKGGYKVPVAGTSIPTYLIESEYEPLYKELLTGNMFEGEEYQVLAYFMLGVFAGPRYSDWELFDYNKNVIGQDLVFQARKNRNKVCHPITPGSELEKVLKILKKIGPLKVPYYKVLLHLETIQKHFKLTKEIGTHTGRHTFGYRCAANDVPKAVAAKLFGNTEKVVEIYYHLTGEHVKKYTKKLAKTDTKKLRAA